MQDRPPRADPTSDARWISPELVLVDPTLRDPDATREEPTPEAPTAGAPGARRRRHVSRGRSRSGPLGPRASARTPLVLLVVAAAVSLTVTRPSPADEPILVDEPGMRTTTGFTELRPSALGRRRAWEASSAASGGEVLAWTPVEGARYYAVQIYRDGERVFEAWPERATVTLPARWRHDGREERLVPGVYHAYVWPGIGPRERGEYGPRLGEWTLAIRD